MVHPAGCMTVARLNRVAQEPGIPLFFTERHRCDGDPMTNLRRVYVSGRTHTRYHLHFTPTSSSWLNQVERWFGLITQRAIRRGSFRSVKELVQKIEQFVAAYNANAKPFLWHATAESILEKLGRLCNLISGTAH